MNKKLLFCMIALLLVLLLPVTAFAGTYSASSFADLQTIFNDAASDSDVEIVINLNGDIDWEDFLTATAGKVFTLKGTGTNILYNIAFNGDGTVIVEKIDTVEGYVWTQGNADVTINSNVNSSRNASEPAVEANDKSKITINGNVNSDDIVAVGTTDEATIVVNGDVNAEKNGTSSNDDSSITVNGNVNAGDGSGVIATGNSTTTVTGDVTVSSTPLEDPELSDNAFEHQGGSGVVAVGNATVNVTGNVTAGDGYGVNAQGGNGVDTYADIITQEDTATVNVGGNVTGGNAYGTPPRSLLIEGPAAGDGVTKSQGSTVTVGGNAKGGNGYGTASAGNGVTIYFDITEGEEGTVTINGKAIGGSSENEPHDVGGNAIWFNLAQRSPFSAENEFFGSYVMSELIYSAIYLRDAAISKGLSEAEADALVDKYLESINNILSNFPDDSDTWTEDQGKDIFDQAAVIFKNLTPGYLGPKEVYVHQLSVDSGKEFFGAGNMTQEYIDAVATNNINYLVKLPEVKGGKFTSDKSSVKEGETVTLTATLDKGYVVDFVKVNGQAIQGKNGVYTFVMPSGGAEITYGFKASTQGSVPKTNDNSNAFMFVFALALITVVAATIVIKKRSYVK